MKIKKKGFNAELVERTKRDKLEIIVDSCASGKKVFEGLNKLIEFIEERDDYKKFRFVVPLQIGTELKQKLFTDFLYKTLNERPTGGFHEFYHRHKNILRIVDTPDSDAYKFFFAQRAFGLIKNDPSFIEKISDEASEIAKKHFPDIKKLEPEDFKKKYTKFRNAFEDLEEDFKLHMKRKEKEIKHFSKEHSNNPLFDQFIINSSQEKAAAKFGKEMFNDASDSYRILLQAMYSNKTVYNSIGNDREFRKLRHDRGERAIESYLFKNRANSDKSVVSVVISDDAGARESIQKLRKKTDNTVFVLSSYGLTWALKELGIYRDESEGVSINTLTSVEKKREKYANGDKRFQNFKDYKNPEIEEKWAKRFVEVMMYGRWSDGHNQHKER